ncbi:hypothetical protein PR048_012375 [Dryococelus australis]|uniref:C2H2-type domain-containing protein n=1 Tax=Dryococelus australis TaxID=614101 RepID=A0ABQ9HPB2_9NEOP|nr:hypothetical protein PR048_012375 [Dryococelus australis]
MEEIAKTQLLVRSLQHLYSTSSSYPSLLAWWPCQPVSPPPEKTYPYNYCEKIFSKSCHARRHEKTTSTKSLFRAMKHYDIGTMQFMQGDALKELIEICKGSSTGSQQVMSLVHHAALVATDSSGDNDERVNAEDGTSAVVSHDRNKTARKSDVISLFEDCTRIKFFAVISEKHSEQNATNNNAASIMNVRKKHSQGINLKQTMMPLENNDQMIALDLCENDSPVIFDIILDIQVKIRKYFTTQTYSKIRKQFVRDNTNFLCMFRQDDTNLKHIYNDFIGGDMPYENLNFGAVREESYRQPTDFISWNPWTTKGKGGNMVEVSARADWPKPRTRRDNKRVRERERVGVVWCNSRQDGVTRREGIASRLLRKAAEELWSDKVDNTTCIKCAVAAKRKALNWCVVLSYCVHRHALDTEYFLIQRRIIRLFSELQLHTPEKKNDRDWAVKCWNDVRQSALGTCSLAVSSVEREISQQAVANQAKGPFTSASRSQSENVYAHIKDTAMQFHLCALHARPISVERSGRLLPECKGGGNGRPRENPLTSGIVRHDSHWRKSWGGSPGDLTRLTLVGGEQSNRYVARTCNDAISYEMNMDQQPMNNDVGREYTKDCCRMNPRNFGVYENRRWKYSCPLGLRAGAGLETVANLELVSRLRLRSNKGDIAGRNKRSIAAVRLIISHLGEPGSIPDRFTRRFPPVGIVLDDAFSRRDFFSGILYLLRPFIPVLLHTRLISPSSALNTSSLGGTAAMFDVQLTSPDHRLSDMFENILIVPNNPCSYNDTGDEVLFGFHHGFIHEARHVTPEEILQWIYIWVSWRPGNRTPTAYTSPRKYEIQVIAYRSRTVGWGAVVLEPHGRTCL